MTIRQATVFNSMDNVRMIIFQQANKQAPKETKKERKNERKKETNNQTQANKQTDTQASKSTNKSNQQKLLTKTPPTHKRHGGHCWLC